MSIGHAALAEIYLCINTSIAFFASESFRRLRAAQPVDAPTRATTILPILVYVQILAGALTRHLGAGLAIPDFPTSMGRLVPRFTSTAIMVNFIHRAGAVLVTLALIVAVVGMIRSRSSALRRLAMLLVAVVCVQIYLGASIVWNGAAEPRIYHSLVGDAAIHLAKVTSLHVVTGASLLAISLLAALTARSITPSRQASQAVSLIASEVPA